MPILNTFGKIETADATTKLREHADDSINCIVTSPPYNKKGINNGRIQTGNQIWAKHNIDYNEYHDNLPEDEYKQWLIGIVNEMYRILTPDGSIFFNHKPRRHDNRVHLPTEFIHKTNAKIYQLIIWNRRNSPNIRNDHLLPTTEHIYWLTKNKPKTYRNQLDGNYLTEIWDIPHQKQIDHPAPFPPQLVENCIKLTTDKGDIVLDPFNGSGTTTTTAHRLSRQYIGYDIDPRYTKIAQQRIKKESTTCRK